MIRPLSIAAAAVGFALTIGTAAAQTSEPSPSAGATTARTAAPRAKQARPARKRSAPKSAAQEQAQPGSLAPGRFNRDDIAGPEMAPTMMPSGRMGLGGRF